jgi:hypothetical protein
MVIEYVEVSGYLIFFASLGLIGLAGMIAWGVDIHRYYPVWLFALMLFVGLVGSAWQLVLISDSQTNLREGMEEQGVVFVGTNGVGSNSAFGFDDSDGSLVVCELEGIPGESGGFEFGKKRLTCGD